MRPGVTEILAHPAIDSEELRASHPDWDRRVDDHAALARDEVIAERAERAGVTFIGFRELRELQRAG
jgi:hypothetical protein